MIIFFFNLVFCFVFLISSHTLPFSSSWGNGSMDMFVLPPETSLEATDTPLAQCVTG